MRIFVTGATGFVGSAIVKELLDAGHKVLSLARSASSADQLIAIGAEVHRGSLDDLESLKRGAELADGVIHTAFIHDFSKFGENCETDRGAIEAMGSILAGTDKPLIITSGTGLFNLGRLVTEDDQITVGSASPRKASEEAAAVVAAQGVKISIVRLPPSVHDAGDYGFVPLLIALAREKSMSAYIGDGDNRWPAVHRLDAARLFRLALEKNVPSIYHAVGEEGLLFREIAEVIGKNLALPVVSKSGEDAAEYFGWFQHFASLNSPASSEQTRKALNWQPTHRGLIADLDSEAYFKRSE
ncbi:NAD-dependent epimerase/dehydratase family protein [Pedobacter sp. HMF7647]|uniref:NAD-dependent epimerase/dehydratase family protein n=1 Tax=Hufsiella arboris TaxID=2695275 RepID=A0A7K1Y8H0_9SPHI|nr:SDR family oxidoreductase [Hufsiella arboris]MXV50867.1 NAD-dependent epimerase/dehydratase family protein [Hufsiella arboris]